MKKAQYEIIETSPILTDIKGLQSYCQCGRFTALKIAEQAGAVVRIGKLLRFNVNKIRAYLENVSEL